MLCPLSTDPHGKTLYDLLVLVTLVKTKVLTRSIIVSDLLMSISNSVWKKLDTEPCQAHISSDTWWQAHKPVFPTWLLQSEWRTPISPEDYFWRSENPSVSYSHYFLFPSNSISSRCHLSWGHSVKSREAIRSGKFALYLTPAPCYPDVKFEPWQWSWGRAWKSWIHSC